MKKKAFIILSCCIALVLQFCTVAAIANYLYNEFINTTYSAKVTLDNEIIDNDYNNQISTRGNLLKVENKLYYYYGNHEFRYGLYEISNEAIHRIYWRGVDMYILTASPGPGPMMKYSNEIVSLNPYKLISPAGLKSGQITYFDRETYEYEPYYNFPFTPTDDLFYYFQIKNNQIYYMANANYENRIYDDETNSLYLLENNKLKLLIERISNVYYIDDEKIYYFLSKTDSESILMLYDIKTEQTKELLTVQTPIQKISTIIVDHNTLFYYNYEAIFKIDLNKLSIEEYFANSCCNGFNYYNQEIFVSVGSDENPKDSNKNGLYIINTETNIQTKIYSKAVDDIYILDPIWIYFTDNNANLYRITRNGKTVEEVFVP